MAVFKKCQQAMFVLTAAIACENTCNLREILLDRHQLGAQVPQRYKMIPSDNGFCCHKVRDEGAN